MEIPSVAIHPSSPPAQADQPSVGAQEIDTARAAAGKILPPSSPPLPPFNQRGWNLSIKSKNEKIGTRN